MPRGFGVVVLLGACLFGCGPSMAQPAIVRASAPAEPESPSSSSEFFVVAEGLDGEDGRPSRLQLMASSRPSFPLSAPLEFHDGAFRPWKLGDAIVVSGRLPNDLWALTYPDCQKAGIVDTPACPYGFDVVHWQNGRWSKQAFLEQDISGSKDVSVIAWTKQRALTLVSRTAVTNDGKEVPVHTVDVHGAEPLPALRARTSDERHIVDARVVGPDEVLVFGVGGDQKPFLERWIADRRTDSLGLPVGTKVWASDWSHVLALEPNGKTTMYDGSTWKSFELPAGSRLAQAYAREPSGREWLVTSDGAVNARGEPRSTRVFARRPGEDWVRVPLPSPTFPGASHDVGIEVTDVQVAGEGDVWLRGWTEGDCRGRGVVLHDQRPKSVCFLAGDARACDERPRGRPVDTSQCERSGD